MPQFGWVGVSGVNFKVKGTGVIMTGTMQAQVLYEPELMKLETRDIPRIAADEVLVEVKATGICGSDISYYYGQSPLETADGKGPLYLGHEIAGVVVEVGSIPAALQLFSGGERVAVNPVQQCNTCPACMRGEFNCCAHVQTIGVNVNGGFAQYVKVKYTHAYTMPDAMSFAQGAVAEPLACATYGVKRLDVRLGQTVVIFGSGTIGLFMVQLARASGAGQVILAGVEDHSLGLGLELGAQAAFNTLDTASPYYTPDLTRSVGQLTGGEMAPRAIVATSHMQALQSALGVTCKNSTVVYFGLPGPKDMLALPVLDAINMNRTIKFSWLAPLVWDDVFKAVANGQIDVDRIVTHRFSLEDAERGIRFMRESKEDKVKGIVVL